MDVAADVPPTDAGGNGNTEADQHQVTVDTDRPVGDDRGAHRFGHRRHGGRRRRDHQCHDPVLHGDVRRSGERLCGRRHQPRGHREGEWGVGTRGDGLRRLGHGEHQVWTFKVDASGGDGTVTVDVAADVPPTDAGGNGNTEADQHQVTVDTTAPTVTITASRTDSVQPAATSVAADATTNVDDAVLHGDVRPRG